MKRLLLTVSACLAMVCIARAQPGNGNPGSSPTPLDGGVTLLIAAGAALGGKKAYDKHKSGGGPA